MRSFTCTLLLLLLLPAGAPAAIGVLLASDDMVGLAENPVLNLQLRLYDPLLRRFVAVDKLQLLGVQHLGEQTDLRAAAKPPGEAAAPGWTGAHPLKRPGDYTFSVEFAPQWDAAEEQFVIPSAKLCVNAHGLEEGWDEPVGLDAEIVPLARPYGLATGSLFSGQILLKGEPAPYALVAIVTLGTTPDAPPTGPAPAPAYLVQKVRADAGGVFHAALPRSGWWGFAATLDADWTLPRNGKELPVTLVTSFWVLTRDP